MSDFRIGSRWVGPAQRCFVVAEMSANHCHDYARAEALIHLASEAGADAVKIQSYTPDTLTIDCDRECFRLPKGSPWAGRTLYEVYREAYTPWEWHAPLMELANRLGLEFFSTAYDESAVDLLEKLRVPAYKVASFELVDLALLGRIARTGKPVILSVGMGSLGEIEQGLAVLRHGGAGPIVLLKCTSAYPALPSSMNLRTIPHLASTFGVCAGLSDHTLGGSVAVASVALGAVLVEKHFTVSRQDGGPDAQFSMEPQEFAQMVAQIREAEASLGCIAYGTTPEESVSHRFRRSLFVVENVKCGELFTASNVRSIRPGVGLPTRHLESVLGRRAACDVDRGTPLRWEFVARS